MTSMSVRLTTTIIYVTINKKSRLYVHSVIIHMIITSYTTLYYIPVLQVTIKVIHYIKIIYFHSNKMHFCYNHSSFVTNYVFFKL